MKADLHTHSTASDGQYRPSELVRLAKDRGIEILALTDHDTTDGLDEAVRAGEAVGLRVVRGIELSAREWPTFHILGYGLSPDAPALRDLCGRMRRGRDERKYRIIEYLAEKGIGIPLEEVEAQAGGGIVGRPHFARVLVQRGLVADSREAFDRYLDTEEFQRRIEREKPPVRECVETILESGGTASLAHPYQIGIGDEELDALVRDLRDLGLGAIECRYPRYTAAQTELYLRLAEKYGLHVTGGSDFHGEKVKPDIALAAWDLDLDWLL